MLIYPDIHPVALDLGAVKIHWYGLMYLVGFLSFYALGRLRARRKDFVITPDQVSDLLFYGAMGVILGGRIGYVLFYDFAQFSADPLMLLRIWEGGMSFHGGLIGVTLAMWLFARKLNTSLLHVTDFISPMVPIGLGAGRIGNFINGELWGRVTDVPWGMVFPHVDQFARHPSQLYQATLEGIVLFVILWFYAAKPRPTGAVTGTFLLVYGVLRFFSEFAREPDAHLGFILMNWLTMGQLLSVPLIILGLFFLIRSSKTATSKQ